MVQKSSDSLAERQASSQYGVGLFTLNDVEGNEQKKRMYKIEK